MNVFVDIGHGLREGFFMFWETLWALVLGFGLSGAVQAFVSRREMERVMGDHSPGAVTRATGLGMVSSSCSYAATAMAKSLFEKGADFISAMVFMFASTNLVLELGIVLIVLMGWQFAAAEFVGGPIMIVLLVVFGSIVLSKPVIERARRRVREQRAGDEHHHNVALEDDLQRAPWSTRLRSKAGWSDAAGYTMADLKMLRRELVIGYVVAGFLAVLVSNRVWNDVFLHGHGALTSIENVIVGPVIAFISFVCSIGNVPMAAALWHGGISFGGVISFIFADLIALPLVLIYRKYYGGRLALRLTLLFWGVMAAAGLIVEGLFALFGIIPDTRPAQIVHTGFALNYTSVLNVLFLGAFGVLYWLYRNRERFGGGEGYANDPTCGMQVEIATAPARAVVSGTTYYFCSDGCRDQFLASQGHISSAGSSPKGQ
ncbi:MAG: uncharacterized protein QOC87_398 [Actinomycetota bacterium]|nr:uncharacterized protein [Actinomycetota bacterium]